MLTFRRDPRLRVDPNYDITRQYYISPQATGIRALPDLPIHVYLEKPSIECQNT